MNRYLLPIILVCCLLVACVRSAPVDSGSAALANTASTEAVAVVADGDVSAEPEVAVVATATDVPGTDSSEVQGAVAPELSLQSPAEFTESQLPPDSDVAGEPLAETAAEDYFAEVSEILGESGVAAVISQPEIPQQFRPPGVPVLRPGRLPKKATLEDNQKLVAAMPQPLRPVEPKRPPRLLPEPEVDTGIVYVVPFVTVMVPREVQEHLFDRFVDLLNEEGEELGLKFLILKEGLRRAPAEWLAVRKYVLGEVFAYVEDSGCCNTDLRASARMNYFKPNQETPVLNFEYPVKTFFDHDRSSLEIERIRLAEDVATALAAELMSQLKN